MIKSFGNKKINTAVLISGKGTNLKSLIKFSLSSKSPINIILVISDKSNAGGLKIAKSFKIRTEIINYKIPKNAENQILKFLTYRNIRLVCLAGFMKILSKLFLKKYTGTIINIHPSLLPKYKGLNTHERAIENKDTHTGCTVHFVSSKVDSGKIILQKRIRIRKNDTKYTLEQKVKKIEHKVYPDSILKLYG